MKSTRQASCVVHLKFIILPESCNESESDPTVTYAGAAAAAAAVLFYYNFLITVTQVVVYLLTTQ